MPMDKIKHKTFKSFVINMASFITEKANLSRILMKDQVKSTVSSSSYLTYDQHVKHMFFS